MPKPDGALTGTPYGIHYSELCNPLAWVKNDYQTYWIKDKDSSCSEATILTVVEPKSPESDELPPAWYYKASVPEEALTFEAITCLIVLPYLAPAEAVFSRTICKYPDKQYSECLELSSYSRLLTAAGAATTVDDDPAAAAAVAGAERPAKRCKNADLKARMLDHVEKRKSSPMMLLGNMAAAFSVAAGMDVSNAATELTADTHLPTRVLFVVNHANLVHTDSPVIVLYERKDMGKKLLEEFGVASVQGYDRARAVFTIKEATPAKKQKEVNAFIEAAAIARNHKDPPPVFVVQIKRIMEGIDGLQVCNVMYQTSLSANPQDDIQAARRIFRPGQEATKVYLYRLMNDSYFDQSVLQQQIERAGGWRQKVYSGEVDVCKLLDIPESTEVRV